MTGFDAEFVAWDEFGFFDYPHAYWKCGLLAAAELNARNSTQPAKYFLATDNERIRKLALQQLPPNSVLMFERPVTRKVMSGHATAIIDMMLLSLTEDVVVTSMSTFGYVAAGITSHTPLLVTFQAQCIRELSSQPCFHKWSYVFDAKCYDRHQMLSSDVRFCGPLAPPYRLVEGVW